MKKEVKENQEEVWDNIAKVWKGYRKKPLPEVGDFLKGKEGKILDLCCGSGRNLIPIKGEYYCVDFSQEMLKYAEEKAKKMKIDSSFIKSKANNLPFEDNFFDFALFINSLHSIKDKKLREKSLHELFRVLKPGGEALISIWNKEQERFKVSEKEIFIPWKINNKIFQRYYYLYEKEEIINQLKKGGFKIFKNLNEKDDKKKFCGKNIIFIIKK